MIFWFIYYCLKHKVNPWWFFQLNAGYFNRDKGIYSKYDINLLIPHEWRLNQNFDNISLVPVDYPVFVKPEWGQNSYGIYRADSESHLSQVRDAIAKRDLSYLVQEAAKEPREFEIFYIRRADSPNDFAVLSITEVKNRNENRFPINGVHNSDTYYRDRTMDFTAEEIAGIWQNLRKIGQFRVARVGLKANSEVDLLQGLFHIVEINLFTPMPLNLLDPAKTWPENTRFIKRSMVHLMWNAKAISSRQIRENIFFRKLIAHYKVKP
jgi:hypothetical protein